MNIAIFSQERDLHGRAVADRLSVVSGVKCFYIASDCFTSKSGIRWECHGTASLRDHQGRWFEVNDLDLVWWRRMNQPQADVGPFDDPNVSALVENEWRGAVAGIVLDRFRGVWVNNPARDAAAGNKLIQATKAVQCGLRVPRTVVTQEPEVAREFCQSVGGRVVIKKLVGAPPAPLATVELSEDDLTDDESIRCCPSLYQEKITTSRHLRVSLFGERCVCVQIESQVLDWRRDLSGPFRSVQLDAVTKGKLIRLLNALGLEMGVFDLMLVDDGEPVFIELNPQGQFLFAQALSNTDHIEPLVAFFIERASASPRIK